MSRSPGTVEPSWVTVRWSTTWPSRWVTETVSPSRRTTVVVREPSGLSVWCTVAPP
ncbi:hypothetical protein [Actinomycetospora aeridis]|uniref:Uncharacterized protein n=1 Tax=Actinomycetospora aeridis TaxID=3129231 RepID=A0ABU8NFG2_9PSEU